MELRETIRCRQSIRSFTDQKVSKEDMEKIVEAGVLAPTGRNTQNLLIVGLVDQEKLSSLLERVPCKKNFYNCTAIAFVFEKSADRLSDLNAGAAMENMLLQATDLGIASCWIHSVRDIFEEKENCKILQEILELKKPYKLLETIALGYQAEKTPIKEKDPENGKVL